jgi:biopolymer transport protein ExbD
MTNVQTPIGLWRVRQEDSQTQGHAIEFHELARAVEDGILSETHEVRAPGEAAWTPVGDHPILSEWVPYKSLIRNRPYDDADMDMTPMIDVTFQLLIFFMITACFVVQKTLPTPHGAKDRIDAARTYTIRELQKDNVIVRAKADGSIAVDGQAVELAGLEDAVRASARGRPNVEMVLDADDDVTHEVATMIYDAAAGAQIEQVHLAKRGAAKPAPGKK